MRWPGCVECQPVTPLDQLVFAESERNQEQIVVIVPKLPLSSRARRSFSRPLCQPVVGKREVTKTDEKLTGLYVLFL